MTNVSPLHGSPAHKPTWDCIVCTAETLDDIPPYNS